MPFLIGRHFLETEMKLAERYFGSRKGGNRAAIVETSNALHLLLHVLWFRPLKQLLKEQLYCAP